MTCRGAELYLVPYASGAAVPPEVVEHFADCQSCRSLVSALKRDLALPPLSPEEVRRIADSTLRDLQPVAPLMPEHRLVLLLVAIACAVAGLGAAIMGTAGWHALGWGQRCAVFACIGVEIGLLAFSLGRQIVPGARLIFSPGRLVAAALACLIVLFAVLFRPNAETAFVATGLFCLKIGLSFAIPTGLLVVALLVRGAILDPVWTGLTAGGLAGVAALSVLELFCPNLNMNHILGWHLGAAMASGVLGLAVGLLIELLPASATQRGRPR